jgi:hypothetical protein
MTKKVLPILIRSLARCGLPHREPLGTAIRQLMTPLEFYEVLMTIELDDPELELTEAQVEQLLQPNQTLADLLFMLQPAAELTSLPSTCVEVHTENPTIVP